jgi:hypothetical protein
MIEIQPSEDVKMEEVHPDIEIPSIKKLDEATINKIGK